MKKFLTVALLTLISVNLSAIDKGIKAERSLKGFRQGQSYKLLVSKLLGLNTFNDNQKKYYFYAKLYKTNKEGKKGAIVSKDLCKNGIWKFRTPSKGLYIAELTYNKKLDQPIKRYLSKKYKKIIESAPRVIQNFKLKITK